MRKGQMEFNWMFVIIAGAVILAFFVTFTMRYIDIQNKKDNAIVASDIYNALYGLQKSAYQTETPIDLYLKTDLKFSCKQVEVGNFFSQSLEKVFVFAPKEITTDKINVFLKPWKYPFKIASLFYLSAPNYKYYIVFDSTSSSFVKSLEFPKSFNIIKTASIPNIKDPNSKIISFTSKAGDVQLTPSETGYAVINGKQYPVLGLPLLYAAMFSDNYPCVFDRLNQKFLDMIEIYKGKVDYMFSTNTNCDYSQLKNTLSKMEESIKNKNYDSLIELSRTLDEQNNNLLSSECNPLY